jgi:GTP cyclohydrolase I
MSSQDQAPASLEGRDFFNTLFSSALGVANLEHASLGGSSSTPVSPPPPPKSSLTRLDKDNRADGLESRSVGDKVKGVPSQGSIPSPMASSTSKAPIADDNEKNFEEAVGRRLAATMASSKLYDSNGDDEVGSTTEEEREPGEPKSARGRQTSSRSVLAMSRMPSSTSGTRTPVTDKDGLGWPAKGSLVRMNSTADQAAQTSAKLSNAVKTILECLGEDPSREGLKKTPERYAKALLWMTRGYEVKLSGEHASVRRLQPYWHHAD